MALLAKKYTLVEESAYNRLKQRPAKPRNPFQNVDVATTKDIGSSMKALMGSDADASTKQLMFSSLLNHYRDSFKKATGKRKRLDKGQNMAKKNTKRDNQQQNPVANSPQPHGRDDESEGRRTPPLLLPVTPPETPIVRKRPQRKRINQTFDQHRAAEIFGGFVSTPTAKRLSKVLNELNSAGLVKNSGKFTSFEVGDRGTLSAYKIKRAIREVVLNGQAQKADEQAIATELQKRGVKLV